mgnify:CR=1 FL=1
MKCIDCIYHYITPEDKYPCCHFKPDVNGYKAPCEYDDEDMKIEELEEFWQIEDMGFDPCLGCYTDDC